MSHALVPSDLVPQILERLTALADEERREMSKGYYPSSLETLGVKTPDLRAVVRDLWREHRSTAPEVQIARAQALVDTGVLEARLVAYELLGRSKPALRLIDAAIIEALARGNDNWVAVDVCSGLVVGVAWRIGRVEDEDVLRWTRDPDRWMRRAALVATLGWNQKARGGTGDTPRTLMICERLIDDHDDMVAKAMSWALRELSKRDPEAARSFLDAHEARLASRVRRELRAKLETGRKNPKR
jgi:3-methyladenine DNA glycosylase AlkD